jgi:hypothetical protein
MTATLARVAAVRKKARRLVDVSDLDQAQVQAINRMYY